MSEFGDKQTMKAKSLVELVRMADLLKISAQDS
jgi:hypothetical protein